MSAADHLGPQFMYHVSPARNRAQIDRYGLEAASPFDPEIHEHEGMAPEGVYGTTWKSARTYGGHGSDVWRVHLRRSGITAYPDPDEWGSGAGPGESFVVPHSIKRQHISLVEGIDDW